MTKNKTYFFSAFALVLAIFLLVVKADAQYPYDRKMTDASKNDKALKETFTTKQIQSVMSQQIEEFQKTNKIQVKGDAADWKLLTDLVGSTPAPSASMEASAFLEEGFGTFLEDYAEFWGKRSPGAKDITIDASNLEIYYRERRDSCGENPCPAPPCCRTGVRCGVCTKKFEFPKKPKDDYFRHREFKQ